MKLMKLTESRRGLAIFIAGVVVLSAVLFVLCYLFDNKYAFPGPQAENGVLLLDGDQLQNSPAIFLTHGWEIYRDRLFEPSDFAVNAPHADEIVYIGQYGGFEGNDISRSPHGSATYRMNIVIPSEPGSYTLELPEIYSAYKLYINGIFAEQFGNPNPGAYQPQTGIAAISFLARNNIEIIIAASDYSHMYSGMVYPPAFGVSSAVSRLTQPRLILRAASCAIALGLAAFFLLAGIFMKRRWPMILYGLLCMCFVGYTCYPVVKAILRSGMAWYGFENFCFCSMFLLVMLLQRHSSGDKGRLSRAFLIFGAIVTAFSILRAIFPSGDVRLLAAYSVLIGLYKWGASAFLTLSMARRAGKNKQYTMLSGIIVFDCALVMDRLLPTFEPICFGWFIEIAGSVLVLSIGVVLGQDIVRQYRERLGLANSIRIAEMQIALQGEQFIRITQSIEQTKATRHDIRHQLAVMNGYLASGDIDGARAYIDNLNKSIPVNFEQTLCENFAVNAVALHYLAIAKNENIEMSLKLAIPQTVGHIEDKDLCIIIGNLLENGIEACRRVADSEAYIKLSTYIRNDYLTIVMDNSTSGKLKQKDGAYLSSKRAEYGIGLSSIEMIAKKHDGTATFETKGDVFLSSVVIRMT